MHPKDREPRKIAWTSGGPDPQLVQYDNAHAIIQEFTSSARIATLERIPTQAEVLAAIDTCLSLLTPKDAGKAEILRRLRPLFEAWIPCVDVPDEITRTMREWFKAWEMPDPPAGWDVYNGYPDTWGTQTDVESPPAPSLSPEEAAGVAYTMESAATVFSFMNFAALLASPRVWAKASARPSREEMLQQVDGYLAAIEKVTLPSGEGPSPSRGAEVTARHLRSLCETWDPGPELPQAISSAARAVLDALGFSGPPQGWDTLEGPKDD